MIFLPIVERELRVAARRSQIYRARFVMATIAILFCGWQLLTFSQGMVAPGSEGQSLFRTLSALAFIYSLFVGTQVTADCLSAEKREGTLGLLFLTDLKGYDVILGKLVASSINSFYGLIAILPLLALPLLLGGITATDFWRMVLVLLNTLFFSLAIGMLVSTVSRHERKAMMATFLAVLLITIGPLWGIYLLGEVFGLSSDFDLLLMVAVFTPAYPFFFVLFKSGPFAFPIVSFWWSLVIIHLVSWFLLFRASSILPRVWSDKTPNKTILRWRERCHLWVYGDSARRKAFRTHLLEVNPFLWLAGRDRLKPRYAWGFLAAMFLVWLGGYWSHGDIMLERYMLLSTLFLWHTFFKIWMISEACSRLVEDRRAGALELLLSTALSVSDILRGQWLALRRQFLKPVLALLAFDLLLLWFESSNLSTDQRYTRSDFVVILLAGAVMLVADLCTLTAVGMWQGVLTQNTNRAIAVTAFRVLVLPWFVFLALRFIYYLITGLTGAAESPKLFPQVMWWVVIGLANDLILWRSAKQKLGTEFREMATFQSESPKRSGSPFFIKARTPRPQEAL
jgi:ABC-type Na+ efflux pump permease subunit